MVAFSAANFKIDKPLAAKLFANDFEFRRQKMLQNVAAKLGLAPG